MPEELRIRIELGPNAPIESLSSAVNDLAVVCEVGSELQRRVSRAELLRRLIRERGPEPFFDEPEFWDYRRTGRWPIAALVSAQDLDYPTLPGLSRRLASYIQEFGSDDDVIVQELHYSNPIDAQMILASGGVVLGLLRMVRDWSANRRIKNALANDVEDEVRMQKELRKRILQGISDGTIPIPEQWVDTLLTDRSVRAFDRLSRRNVELPTVPGDNNAV